MLTIGLMSGTSTDGIDAALVELARREGSAPGWQVALKAFLTMPYPEVVRQELFRLFAGEAEGTARVCHMNYVVGELFARAAQAVAAEGGVPMEAVECIASHGQTIWHQAQATTVADVTTRATLQIGEPGVIAERTGCTVVANFRARDIAAGGHGAPLAPYVDYLLLADPVRPRIAQNIGGIANLTYLPPACPPEAVLAFDTGPGNAMIDAAVSLASNGEHAYDQDGRQAARGTVQGDLLERLLRHDYFDEPPPKSTGRELFGLQWVESLKDLMGTDSRDDDLVATLTRFTVESIADAYERWLPSLTSETEIVLSGGGAHNPTLVMWLAERVRPARVRSSDEFGLPVDAKEAMLFAILGAETLRGAPGNLPGATGAARPVILGQIVPGRDWPQKFAHAFWSRAES